MIKVETHLFKNSSNLLRADYDNLVNVMTLFFKNGTTYQYVAIPYEVFEEFKKAESAGRFFLLNIKGKFEHMKR